MWYLKPGYLNMQSGWWFGTFLIFPYSGNNHPNWRAHIFQMGSLNHQPIIDLFDSFMNSHSTDWFKGKITGKPHISWENQWFPVDFPINQSIEITLIEQSPHVWSYPTEMLISATRMQKMGKRWVWVNYYGLTTTSHWWWLVRGIIHKWPQDSG